MKIHCVWCGVYLDSDATMHSIGERTYWDEVRLEYRKSIECPVCKTEIVKDTGELV